MATFAVLAAVAGAPGCSGSGSGSSAARAGASAEPVPAEQSALIAKGRKQFLYCSGCHTVEEGPSYMTGPHLVSIVGRPVASVEGFDYTEALRAMDFVWDEARLDQWLERPQQLVDDMCVPFTGIADPLDRQALIVNLKQPDAS